MQRLHAIASAAALFALLFGCRAHEEPATSKTEISSATWTTEHQLAEDKARLAKERDDARAALIDEREAHRRDIERFNADTVARRARDDLEMRALEALTTAEVRVQALRKRAPGAPSTDRLAGDVRAASARLRALLQRMHADPTEWEDVKADIESTIDDLERAE